MGGGTIYEINIKLINRMRYTRPDQEPREREEQRRMRD
jgi:hypothetical protein